MSDAGRSKLTPCKTCGGVAVWRIEGQPWRCFVCFPPPQLPVADRETKAG